MSKRITFFLSHLLISFFIAFLVVGLVFFIWYPTPLAIAVGVTHIFLMMLAIDVIIGPVLGVLIYKEGKKTLKIDLTIIITIQIIFLCYGIHGIEQGRPVWIAYNVDRFELIRKNEIIADDITQALPQFQQVTWLSPQWVGVELSKNKKQREEDMFTEVLAGISLAQKPERYVKFNQAKPKIKQRAKDLKELVQYNDRKRVQQILAKYPQTTAFIPLKSNSVDMTVLVNKNTGEVVKIVDLRPWK